MGLIKCHECEKEISSSAKSCPNCGATPKKKTSAFTWIVAVFFGIPAIMAIAHNSSTSTPDAAPSPAMSDKMQPVRLAIDDVIRQLKPTLRNPDSLKVADAMYYPKKKMVCLDYRAQNKFGGTSIYHIIYTPKLGAVYPFDDKFMNLWKNDCSKGIYVSGDALSY